MLRIRPDIFSPYVVKMTATEEPKVETPVEEKVKKERSDAQKAVLEKARVKGLEVRLQKAKERKEAKENALREVEERHRKKDEVVEEKFEPPAPEPEIENFEPEVETKPEVEPVKPEPVELPREKTPEPPEPPPPPEFQWKHKRLMYTI